MTQFAWKNGMAWDVTCVDTLAKSHIRKTISVAGADEGLKAEKYVGSTSFAQLVSRHCFGRFGTDRQANQGTQISIEIQRGNAASVPFLRQL